MVDRDYMIQRIMSKSKTKSEFDYDCLSAPPISSMFSQEDIYRLNYIATSNLYSSKLRLKYQLIDDIMTSRGFEKYVAGTNRVTYMPTFSNSFVVKIPYCKVALQDNMREYQNQFLIKPFCTKVFEITPCGTIGVFERVKPITHTEEYLSIADDIYTLLSEYLIGEYVIDDIGTEYFMNIGVRKGFGPVLLDFPYIYRVDPKKLFCWAKDESSISGTCDGEITYDPGFNYLYCKKCGCRYKPFELGEQFKHENKMLKGVNSMFNLKVRTTGGSKLVKSEKVTGEFADPAKVIESNALNKKVEKMAEEEAKVTVNGASAPRVNSDIPNLVIEEEVEEYEPDEEEEVTVEDLEDEPKEIINPLSFDASIKGTNEDPGFAKDVENEQPEEFDIDKVVSSIVNEYFFESATEEKKNKIINTILDNFDDIFGDNLGLVFMMLAKLLKKNKLEDDNLNEFINDIYDSDSDFIDNFVTAIFRSNKYYINSTIVKSEKFSDSDISMEISNTVCREDSNTELITSNINTISIFDAREYISVSEEEPEEETEIAADDEEVEEFDDGSPFRFYTIESVNQKNFDINLENSKIYVLIDNKGNKFIDGGKIVAVNRYISTKNEKSDTNDLKFVKLSWYNDVVEELKAIKKKEAPIGALPPNTQDVAEEQQEVKEE